ncbi:MAG: adenine phosphoribosyltransferase [Phycisphaerae bacterium]
MSADTVSNEAEVARLRQLIRDIPDFPKPGVLFKDITPLLRDAVGLSLAIEFLTQPYVDQKIDVVSGPESRGFIFASAVAKNLSAGFVPIRKPGRLPYKVTQKEYQLEYGTDKVEMHVDAIGKGDRVLLVDDLLATGGTIQACSELVRSLGGTVVGAAFLIELDVLRGRERLDHVPVYTVLHY